MIKLNGYSLFYLMETFSKMFQCKYSGVFQNGYFILWNICERLMLWLHPVIYFTKIQQILVVVTFAHLI